MKHFEIKIGAVVRVEGYAPARVISIGLDRDYRAPVVTVTVLHTADRGRGGFGNYYRKGVVRTYRMDRCPPRDTVRVSRQHTGRLWWLEPVLAEGVVPTP